jgi:hypothetical protein
LGQRKRSLACEAREPASREGIKSAGLRLGNETHGVESLGEIESAQLASRRLRDEEVAALDCAAEDRARVALGRQCRSGPGAGRQT